MRGKGYHFSKQKGKWQVEVAYNGYRYYGGTFEKEHQAKKKVKELIELIKKDKILPSYGNGHNNQSQDKKLEILDKIREDNGILKTRQVHKDKGIGEQFKNISKERSQNIKDLKFLSDEDEEVVISGNQNIEPIVSNGRMATIEGLDVLNSIGENRIIAKKTNKLQNNLSELDIANIVAKAVQIALAEVLGDNRVQSNSRNRRSVSK